MENNRSRDVIMAIAGGYLAYTGVQLVLGALEQKQDNYILFIVIGAIFIVFGGTVLFFRAKKLLQIPTVDDNTQEEVEEVTGTEEVSEAKELEAKANESEIEEK